MCVRAAMPGTRGALVFREILPVAYWDTVGAVALGCGMFLTRDIYRNRILNPEYLIWAIDHKK